MSSTAMSAEATTTEPSTLWSNNTPALTRIGKPAASALNAKILQDPRDRDTFYKDLFAYHDNKGTPIERVPRINGREIDLHRLYNIVIGRGGWSKVNYRNEWDELVPDLVAVSVKCVNAAVALKQIYMRFLDRYEKLHFQSDDNDSRLDDADDEHNRHKKWSNKCLLNEVPLKYNYHQHHVSEQLRQAHKMSTDLYRATEYERLLMSLMSPLPNEQDFAINVCTLMSNESKHTLKIDACPKLLDVLLGHAGVYSHYTLRSIFLEFYAQIRRNSLQSFWTDLLRDKPSILELAYDDYIDLPADQPASADHLAAIDADASTAAAGCTFDDGLNCQRASELFDFDGLDFLNLRRGLGTHDYIGQRVYQVATILRNLSYSAENSETLVHSRTFVRFLVMCANIRWGNLHHMGLDMLGNLAGTLELYDPVADDLTRSLLATIVDGLASADRGVIIQCLEVLYKLCRNEPNGEQLHKCLTRATFAQLGRYLSLNDIMLLLYTLECVYALSALGERACASLVQVGGLIGQLVALVTVEAQSYGPNGCILMRVVETVPTTAHAGGAGANGGGGGHSLGQAGATGLSTGTNTTSTTTAAAGPGHGINRWHTLAPAAAGPALPSGSGTVTEACPPTWHESGGGGGESPSAASSVADRSGPIVCPATTIATMPAPLAVRSDGLAAAVEGGGGPAAAATVQPPSHKPILAQQQQQQQQQVMLDNEQFACAWLRATFESLAAPAMGRIEQQDLYRMYLTASAKLGRAGVASQLHFPRAVRSVFGPLVGPNVARLSGHDVATPVTTATLYYEGLRIRAKPLAVVYKGTILQGHIQSSVVVEGEQKDANCAEPSAAASRKIASPLCPAVPAAAADNVAISSKSTQSGTSAGVPSSVITATTSATTTHSTALIKSLLANKVTTVGGQSPAQAVKRIGGTKLVATNTATSASQLTTNVNVIQVAQRQLLQKEKELQQQQHPTAMFAKSGNAPPPLAPLSNNTQQQSPSAGTPSDGTAASTDADNKHSPVVTSNKMLADLLDRKSGGPPFVSNDNKLKRKMDSLSSEPAAAAAASSSSSAKRTACVPVTDDSSAGTKTPSRNAANLYAKLAASLLADEDDEEIEAHQPQQIASVCAGQSKGSGSGLTTTTTTTKAAQTAQSVANQTQPIAHRHQLIVGSTPASAVTKQTNAVVSKLPPAMVLQQSAVGGQLQLQPILQATQSGQPQAATTTQYMLATNSQGQTYLVAQQSAVGAAAAAQAPQPPAAAVKPTANVNVLSPHPPPTAVQSSQTVQSTPQQQTLVVQGTGSNKTIYILQQPVVQQQQATLVRTMGPGTVATAMQKSTVIVAAAASNAVPPTSGNAVQPHQAAQAARTIQQPHLVLSAQQQSTQAHQQPPLQSVVVQQQPMALIDVTQTAQSQQSVLVMAGKTAQANVPASQPIVTSQQAMLANTQQIKGTVAATNKAAIVQTGYQLSPNSSVPSPKASPSMPAAAVGSAVCDGAGESDPNWLFVCDWRGCPRKQFRSTNELYLHVCQAHCPDNIDPNADIYCQWGDGPNLCDNLPRKRFSLMTHLFDRHLPAKALRLAAQRRLNAVPQANAPTAPVTIIKNPAQSAVTTAAGHSTSAAQAAADAATAASVSHDGGGGTQPLAGNNYSSVVASAAMQAIKRHAVDFVNPKELMDENEGPVTKSIRLTAALILRNLVIYTGSAKRTLRFYEPHLASVALSNVESSRTIAQVLFEMSELRKLS